jgi:glycosyltransferase involved in cell wall biosynthesis
MAHPTSSHQYKRGLPLVSIGVPAYNGAQHLAEALESARSQDYPNLEIIIVDDASADKTEAICRRFAAIDPRIRYIRSSRNVGAVANFRKVLALARGTYFTWLAQDDVISDPGYAKTVVEYLESNADVAVCMTSLLILDHEYPGSQVILDLPEIHPERPWRDARREFIRWPQSPVHLALYGMYRRDKLARVPIVPRSYRGRPSSAWWEMPVLTEISAYGRIVAIPICLRSKRSSSSSDGWRTYQQASPFDLFILGARMKLVLTRSVWRLPLPPRERMELLKVTLDNLFRANFQRPFDIGVLIDLRRQELAKLRRVADERSQLIVSLRREIDARLRLLREAGRESRYHDVPMQDPAPSTERAAAAEAYRLTQRLDRYDSTRASLLDFFRPTPAWQLALCEQLNREIGALRKQCEEQLALIHRLHCEADLIVSKIEGQPI